MVKVASNPEFQKRHMTARGLTAVLNKPEEFAKELEGSNAPEGREAIIASGFIPTSRCVVAAHKKKNTDWK